MPTVSDLIVQSAQNARKCSELSSDNDDLKEKIVFHKRKHDKWKTRAKHLAQQLKVQRTEATAQRRFCSELHGKHHSCDYLTHRRYSREYQARLDGIVAFENATRRTSEEELLEEKRCRRFYEREYWKLREEQRGADLAVDHKTVALEEAVERERREKEELMHECGKLKEERTDEKHEFDRKINALGEVVKQERREKEELVQECRKLKKECAEHTRSLEQASIWGKALVEERVRNSELQRENRDLK
ncbi:hypothetical protein BU26DRAFT_592885 [Trematosphaeria pertusa]|uniref:Uncharacterized protein n=1 Tax=Trematosphaeria pertusa TaxID=390896 RepID=A0A6A6IJ99_9PLEO|nr:uncharacterized protein BU26DRAFT_592885 [Trematosphaeria pertusa]KAF2249623.1 hypothetical protein BU26DRAFT_592885 [Trematosphaeria pertusa]